MLSRTNGFLGYMENITIGCKSWDFNLDLGKLGYKKNKWGHLLRTYIDYDKLLKFREDIKTTSGMSFTFYFNQKQINNGSCLIAIVLTRDISRGPWKRVNVLYRTTETQRRMAADLALIQAFINELPQDICNFECVVFHMVQAYISGMVINGYLDLFGVPIEGMDNHPWIDCMLKNRRNYFTKDSKISTYQSQARMQKLALGLMDCPEMLPKDLSIDEWFLKRRK
ncbi:MAG: hypothetical protein J6T10_22825 [Methanobrevibacter sp.]|nr:hypothetical protein [Methanobrevibacter sp.]